MFFAVMYGIQSIQFAFAVVFVSDNIFSNFDKEWTTCTSIITFIFCADMIFHIVCFGWKETVTHWEYIIELILQLAAWTAIGFYCVYEYRGEQHRQGEVVKVQCIVLVARHLRLMSYTGELKDFQMIVATFTKFSVPFASMMFTLYTVMFFYAVIGIYSYNGLITRTRVYNEGGGADYMYIMMSFNDFYAAMLTLF